MMAMVAFVIFTAAMMTAMGVIGMAVAPQWRRVLRLASGRPELQFKPLETLARAERRIAVRRWSSAYPASPMRFRAAA